MLNIGLQNTTIMVYGENQEIFTREIAIAGHHITSAIMKLKNLDYHSSEDLKISEGVDVLIIR